MMMIYCRYCYHVVSLLSIYHHSFCYCICWCVCQVYIWRSRSSRLHNTHQHCTVSETNQRKWNQENV